MSVLQTNLDKDAVLVPGEYLDVISAVQRRRRRWYIRQPWAACWPLCLGLASAYCSRIHTGRQSHTRHVAVRLVLGRLCIGHDCELSVHVICGVNRMHGCV
jgi:hypothetical protein